MMTIGDTDYSPEYDDYPSDEYPPDWQARRQKVLKRDGFTCQACGIRSTRVDDVRFDIDHIVPKSDGGSHSVNNLQTLCPSCHANKHPQNTELERRGRQFTERNKPSLLVWLIRLLLGPLLSSVGLEERTVIDGRGRKLYPRTLSEAVVLPEESGVTVEVRIKELWESTNQNVQQLGRVQDAISQYSGKGEPLEDTLEQTRFIIWSGNDHPHLQEGSDYRIVGAKTSSYDGEFQLVIDQQTVIQAL